MIAAGRVLMFRFMFAVLMLSQVASAQGLAIGFVDVQRVIFEYKKTTDITTTLEKRIRQERTLVAQRKEALRTRMEALDDLRPEQSNDALLKRVRIEKEIALERVEIELSEKNALIQLEQDLVEHMKKVYKEVRREAEAVARDRSLKAVFMSADDKINGRTRNEVSSEILVRPVLWFDSSLDLTSEILQRLNR